MNDYLSKLKSIDDRTVRAMLHVLKSQIRLLGTNVVIEKYDQDGEHRQAFGALFQSDDFTKVKKDTFPSRYVINRNYLSDHYQKQAQPMQIYYHSPELAIGDTVTFTQDNINYKFKVEQKHSYGLSPHVIYKYDLIGVPEDTGNSDSNGGLFDSTGAGDSC